MTGTICKHERTYDKHIRYRRHFILSYRGETEVLTARVIALRELNTK